MRDRERKGGALVGGILRNLGVASVGAKIKGMLASSPDTCWEHRG